MGSAFGSEAELAAKVVAWLEVEGWTVYQEVEPRRYGKIADIVGKRGPVVWVIETKLSLSMELIGQALDWRGRAHQISVATPFRRNRGASWTVATRVLMDYGIGRLEVDPSADYNFGVHERVRVSFSRNITHDFDDLTDEHKTYAPAGSARGRRFTPFAYTLQQLEQLVANKPGITLKDALSGVRHHYTTAASAKAAISKWIREGVITSIETRRDGRAIHLYPAKPEAT